MNLKNDDFLAGAVAAERGGLKVDALASGNMDSVGYSWYRIYDPQSGECVVVLMGEEEGEYDTISSREPSEADDKESCTRAFIKTLNFGGNEESTASLFCVMQNGWINTKYIDANVLRAALEKGAAEIKLDFDFDAWAKDHGFASKAQTKENRQSR